MFLNSAIYFLVLHLRRPPLWLGHCDLGLPYVELLGREALLEPDEGQATQALQPPHLHVMDGDHHDDEGEALQPAHLAHGLAQLVRHSQLLAI